CVIDLGDDEARARAGLAGEVARRRDRLPGEVQACDAARPDMLEAQRVEPDMALQVGDVLAGDVADLAGFYLVQRRAAGEHPRDAVASRLVARMKLGAVIPVEAIDLEELVHRIPPNAKGADHLRALPSPDDAKFSFLFAL